MLYRNIFVSSQTLKRTVHVIAQMSIIIYLTFEFIHLDGVYELASNPGAGLVYLDLRPPVRSSRVLNGSSPGDPSL